MQTNRYTQTGASTKSYDAGLRAHMSSVYNRMSVGVLITALVAWTVSSSPQLLELLLGGPQKYLVMFGPIAILWFGFNPQRMSSQKLMISFVAISALYGASFSVLALVFAGEDIARAFFITAGMFAGLSIFGYTTKKDLSAIGTFCAMGVMGVLLLSIAGLFFEYSSGMHMILNGVTVLLFAGLTAWETQNVKAMYSASHGTEINSRLAWSSALSLYISFVAMFVNILQLMGGRE